jgi:hypothetical protein
MINSRGFYLRQEICVYYLLIKVLELTAHRAVSSVTVNIYLTLSDASDARKVGRAGHVPWVRETCM